MLTIGSGNVWAQTTTTYTFSSKSWAASPANWTKGKDGNQMQSGRGIQVTTGTSGANGTSPKSFTNVSKVVVTYSTNASAGAGSIAVKIGSNTASSKSVTTTGGTTDRTLTYNFSPNQTGSVKVTVTCTTNSIYVKSVAITEAASCTSITPSLSYASVGGTTLTVGSSSSGSPTITGNTGSGTVTYSSNNTSVATVNSSTGVVTAVAAGNATITASIAAEGVYCDGSATANFTITVPAYTVQFSTGTGNPTVSSRTEASGGAGITLPAGPTPACSGDGWVFMGWKETSAQSSTTTAPDLLAAGSTYHPASNCTLYAVYYKQADSNPNYYTKVTTSSDNLTSGQYVIYANGEAMNNALSGSKIAGKSVSETSSGSGIISTTDADIIWTLYKNGTNYQLYNAGVSKYLEVTGENSLSLPTSSKGFTLHAFNTSTGQVSLKSVNKTSYQFQYYNGNFSAYGSQSTAIYFYKRGGTYNSNPTCCTPLGTVSATNSAKTGTTANFTWSEVTGAESYKVKVPGSSSHNDWTTATSGVSVTGLTAGNSYTAYFKAFDSNGSNCSEGPESTIEFTTPKITLGSASGTSTYNEGSGPGSKQTFTVTAVGLTGNLTVTAPTNFAVCATESGSYTSIITLTPTSGAVSTTVYFQLVAEKTAAASPYAGNVTVSGGSATEQTVAVNGTVNQACADPTITVQPAASASYNLNVSATALSVTATKNGTGPTLTYQWYSNTANSKTTPTPTAIDGATSSSYAPPTTATGTKYYFCEVSSGACAVTSNISAITVNTPSITVSETSIAFGDKAKDGSHTETFTVSGTNLASGTGLTLAVTGSSYFTIDQTSVAQTSDGTVATTTITVTYAPTVIGDGHSATITVSSTGAENKTVTVSGNSKYQVTWIDEAVSPAATTYTYVASGKPTFPSNPTGGCDTYTYFYGWAEGSFTTPVTAPTSSSAIKVYKAASEMPNVSGNVTYYAVWSNAAPADYSTTYTSNVSLPTSGTSVYSANVTISGNNYSGAKIGKSGGAGSSSFTVPSGTKKIFLHTVNWYNEDNTLTLSSGTLGVTISPSDAITPPRNSGMEGADNDFTLATLDGTQYKEYTLTGVSSTATINVSSTSRLLVWGINATSSTGEGDCVTKCCTPVGDVHQGVKDATLAYNGLTLEWDDVAAISSWAVTGVNDDTDAPVAAVNIGTPSDEGSTYECVITGLDQYTNYTFTITGTPAGTNCEKIVTVEQKTPCVAPSSLSIASTNDKWDFCAGETMTLTVSGTNISGSATYQWKKHNGSTWDEIDGATSASYSTTMAAAKAGQYCCTVTNPGSSCDATTSGVWVRVWQLHLGDDDYDFTNTGTGTGSNTAVYLSSDTHYEFKLKDNNGGWFGLNSKTVTATESNITLNGTGANVNVTSGLEGNYTFAIDYTNKDNPKVSITYPVGNQPSGRKIWFDKSVITGWTDAGTSDLVWRIGKKANSMTNKDDPANAFTLVPGTDRFYVYETKEYNGFEAWHVANNVAWSGNSDNAPAYDNHSIYTHYHDQSSTDVKYATVYQKYVIGTSGVTLVPTTKKNTDWYCDFWNVTKTDGMLKHQATIESYSHGTVTVSYTKYDGTGVANFTSGSNSDLAHRTILTITATPDAGYQLTSLQVNGADFDSEDEHILSADATIRAVFSPKTTTVTFDKNSGTGGNNGVTATYDADMPTVSVPSRSNYNFGGYYDAETDDNGSGTKYYNANGTSAKIWDKEDAALTLYAQWTGDSYTISYKDQNNETYSGSNLASLPTSHTYGAATALVNGVKTGYTFGGWFDNSSCTGAAVTSIGATAITANTTYYAKWTETDYTVTMAQSPAAGASLTGGTTTAHYNGTINISTNVPAGYAFNGWTSSPSVTFADASATSTSFTMPAGDVTITANFLQTHSATFIGPDGSTLQTVNAIEGATVAYSASTPETCDDGVDPSNYFVGWATNTWSGKVAKGSIVPTFYDIANGDNLPNMGASDVTYYAVFAKRSGTPLTENTYTGDFSSKIFSSSNNTSATVNGISWTLDAYHYDNEWNQVFCTDFSTGNNSRGQKVGSSSNWPAYMSLTTSGISGTITSVAVSTAGNSGVDATVAIAVGGNGWKLKNTNNYSASLTNSNTAYEFTGSGTGSISIDWQEDEENYTNALYFSQVVVKYTTGGDVSYSNYMTSCATCVTPSGLAASAITESGATITWSGTSASGTEGFKVAWNTTNSVPSPLTGSNSADVAKNVKTYDITGLNDETTYYVFVQSKCNSEWSSSTNFTTLAKHDITFTKDNGTLSVVSPVGVVHGQTLTFPNVTSTSCGTFVGWKATEVSDYDNAVAPSPLYKYNGTKENITADESYQAVYRTASGAETNVTDNVTVALTGITGTYGAWSDKTAASAATYAGNTAKNSTNQIQMRSSDDSGIISTISGGKLEQVDVTWASNTSGRTVQIYGKATPYSATSDLYSNDDNVKGTLLGELVYTSDGGTSTLEIDGTYNYIGIKSKSGAAYATNIGIQWWGSEAHYMTAPTCNAMVAITASFSSFTYVYGSGPSATQTFIVSGLNLSTNPLVVTAPTNYEISKTVDGTYTSSVSYTPVAGKVSAETVYIRLKGGLSVGTYNYAAASGVSAASEGATTQKVALNGSVTKASGSIAFTSFNAVDHYEAEMPKGGTSLDVTLTVSVTGDGAVSYGRSPAAGSSAVPATTPTTTLHVTTVGTWTVTANLTAGTSYTSASTTCQVVVYYADHYYDNIHSDVQALVDIDMPLERRGSYSAPDLMDSDKSTGSCAATHYKFMGWISKTAIDGGLANDAAYKAALIPAGTAMTATGESYYAVWAELEE